MVLACRVQRALDAALPRAHRSEPVRFHGGKTSHGDLDVLLACDHATFENATFENALGVSLGATEMVVNHSKRLDADPNRKVLSYSVPTEAGAFQVDVVQVPESAFDFARWYFAFNDLGNLLGRVARRMGFKLSESGLRLEVDAAGERVGEVVVTRDWELALSFLGYDSQRYWKGAQGGFDSLESLFDFVSSSPYFDPGVFLPENRPNAARRRDAARPTYQAFLAWMEGQGLCSASWGNQDKELFRANALVRATDRFPRLSRDVCDLLDHHRRMKAVRARFNGRVVSDVTGLEGPELGAFLRERQAFFGSEEALAEWVEGLTDAELRSAVAEQASEWHGRSQ
ncbi:hypothetical protein [Thioalkalivibrio sp. K90mix]|uniref:hypothetical protein n=1 Tax=Thioalkalivibrio sp. (strain K90mix) TaxID=396595 RepID=UPI0002FFECD7|nr:hypothetical protein [Thioalkalivibrio sp. K90mix]